MLTLDERESHGGGDSAKAKNKPGLYSRLRRIWMLCFVAGVAYVLSFGPACWVLTRLDAQKNHTHFRVVSRFYQPVSVSVIRSPALARNAALWYLELCAAADARIQRDRPTAIGWDKRGYSYTFLSMGAD